MDHQSYIEFRKIAPGDEVLLAEFFSLVISHQLNLGFHPHLFTDEMAYQISHSVGTDWYVGGFIKESDHEELIAYGMLRGWDEGYEIPSLGICVLPVYQHLGLGSSLTSLLILVAKIRKSPAIRLKVYPDNTKAINLYRSLGFEFLDELEKDQLVGYLKLYSNSNADHLIEKNRINL